MSNAPTIYLRQRTSIRHLIPGAVLLILALLAGRIELAGDGNGPASSPGFVGSRLAFAGVWLFASAAYVLLPFLITLCPLRDKGRFGHMAYRFYAQHWLPFGTFLFFGRSLLLGAMEAALSAFILNRIVQLTVATFDTIVMVLPITFATAHTAVEWPRLKRSAPRTEVTSRVSRGPGEKRQ